MAKWQQSPDSLTAWRNDLKPVGTHQGESGNWGNCHISWWQISKLEKEIIIRKTMWGPVQKGKCNNEVPRSPVHCMHKASLIVRWINRVNEGKQGE